MNPNENETSSARPSEGQFSDSTTSSRGHGGGGDRVARGDRGLGGDLRASGGRGARGYLGLAARGFAMGSADVVPGVSGGTMAFILGIYEHLVASIRVLARPRFWNPLLKGRLREASAAADLPFLAAVLVGILVAVFSLARALSWLLDNQPVLVWSFFFGLVLASIPVVGRRVRRWTVTLVMAAVLGAAATFFLVGSVPVQTPDTLWLVFLSGAMAICAMILPGISGAFILVLVGKYEYMLAALNDWDLTVLVAFALGAAVGLLSFAQLLGWLFHRFHDITVAILLGFMAGSLRRMWPWKENVGTSQEGNVLPSLRTNGSFDLEIVWAVLLFLAGLLLVLGLDRLDRRRRRQETVAQEETDFQIRSNF